MDSHTNNTLRQRLYLMGFLVCMLGVVGIGMIFLLPDATLQSWLTHTEPVEEEWSGDAGGPPPAASGAASNGASHNESVLRSTPPPVFLEDAAAIASASQGSPSEHIEKAPAVSSPAPPLASHLEARAAPAAAHAARQPAAARPAATPLRVPAEVPARKVVPESGMGAITIVALTPGAWVDVADHVVTEAPTTLQVPWPADYTMAVHIGDATVYETRLHLSAENNAISFSVDAEPAVAAASSPDPFGAEAESYVK